VRAGNRARDRSVEGVTAADGAFELASAPPDQWTVFVPARGRVAGFASQPRALAAGELWDLGRRPGRASSSRCAMPGAISVPSASATTC
jgi:hypothetical protein